MRDKEGTIVLNDKGRSSGISSGWLALIIAIAVIVADQALKIWVKTSFYLGEDLEITKWFHLKFIENNGMAFGLELWNKLILTFGRIIAVGLFIWFIIKIKDLKDIRKGFIVAVALITAGAAGNIFDCVFYGKIFSNPWPPQIATIFPADGGYAGWFEGRVVDMLYFPFFDFYWPDWIPGIGGSYYEFFAYIFNLADSAICVGVALMLIFYSKDASIAFKSIGGSKEEKQDMSNNK
ncbi:MAG: lipoprotein signal peptidase [Muribaculaceae bacterium]|nr:lipoprotein signal peptidase [Muribaculaceae bacterium]